MFGGLDLDRVDDVRVKLAYSEVPDGPPHEVFLLDAHLEDPGAFDAHSYFEDLEPVLQVLGQAPDPCVVRLVRTHRSGSARTGEVEISIGLTTSTTRPVDHASTEAVTAAFRRILQRVTPAGGSSPGHDEAMAEARLRVQEAYPGASADSLAVTDEEHLAHAHMWSVGMTRGTTMRYHVVLGFVDGMPGTAHVRRMPTGEVVDSVGSD